MGCNPLVLGILNSINIYGWWSCIERKFKGTIIFEFFQDAFNKISKDLYATNNDKSFNVLDAWLKKISRKNLNNEAKFETAYTGLK